MRSKAGFVLHTPPDKEARKAQPPVAASSSERRRSASSAVFPQYSLPARKFRQTSGYSAVSQIRHRPSGAKAPQRTPAGLPFGNPGTGDEIVMAIQQAAQPGRHSIEASVKGCGVHFPAELGPGNKPHGKQIHQSTSFLASR